MNSKRILLIFIALTLLITFSFANETTIHCWRQDISRINGYIASTQVTNCIVGSENYDFICNPGGIYKLTSIQPSTWSCDDGATVNQLDFAILYENIKSRVLKTNTTTNGGPVQVTAGGCKNVTTGNLCYLNGSSYYPAYGTCESGGNVGKGENSNIEYTFGENDYGENIVSARLGVVSPTASSAYDSRIMYKTISNSKKSIFVGTPSMLVFGQEGIQRIGTNSQTGNTTFTLFYTLMNRSQYDNNIVSYTVTCPTGISCTFDGGANKYIGWHVPKETEMIIPINVSINNSKAPTIFAVEFNLVFSAIGVTDCDPTTAGNYCSTQAPQLKVQLGLLDQQDFQAKLVADTTSNTCVGPDGIVGQTGETAAPKVNLSFGNGTNPLISVDECNENDMDGNHNPDGVYCTQAEFLFEIAERVGAIASLRETIQSLEAAGRYTDAAALRNQENKYSSFQAMLRTQNLNQVETTVSAFNLLGDELAVETGLDRSIFGDTWSVQKGKVHQLLTNNTFAQKESGLEVSNKNIVPGTYTVQIDLNEFGEVTTSDYLFINGTLNPVLGLKIYLQKVASPQIDWFFYKSDFNNNLENTFAELWTSGVTAYTTNIAERGVLLKFNEQGSSFLPQTYLETFAYPLYVRVTGNATGDSNTIMRLPSTGELGVSFNDRKDAFSYWTGFASSINDGCDTTSTLTTTKFLPYRVPDLYYETTGGLNQGFLLDDLSHNLSKVVANSKLYLETVLYLPYYLNSTAKVNLATPMGVWTKNNSCTQNCSVEINQAGTTHKVSDLNTIFEKIESNEICVHYALDATQAKNWTIYWNEEEVLKDLSAKKATITDAAICEEGSAEDIVDEPAPQQQTCDQVQPQSVGTIYHPTQANPNGLRDYFPFDGNAKSTVSPNLSISANENYSTGKFGQAYVSTNAAIKVSDYIERPNNIAFSMWIMPNQDINSTNYDYVIMYAESGVRIAFENTGRMSASVGGQKIYSTATSWNANEWVHVVLQWTYVSETSVTKAFYINGVLQETIAGPKPFSTDHKDLFIGGLSQSTKLFPGKIDDLAIFTTTLTQTDINTIAKTNTICS